MNCVLSVSKFIMFIFFFSLGQLLLFPFLVSDVLAHKLTLVILNKEHFLHLGCKLPYLNQFSNSIRNGYHLV